MLPAGGTDPDSTIMLARMDSLKQALADAAAIMRRRPGFWLVMGFSQSLAWFGLPAAMGFFRWVAAGSEGPPRLFASGFFAQEAVLTAVIWSSAVGFHRCACRQLEEPKAPGTAWIEGFFSGPIVLPISLVCAGLAAAFGPKPFQYADGWLSPGYALGGVLAAQTGGSALAVGILLLLPLTWVFHHLALRRPWGRFRASLSSGVAGIGQWLMLLGLTWLATGGILAASLAAFGAAGPSPQPIGLAAGAAWAIVAASPIWSVSVLAQALLWQKGEAAADPPRD